MFIRKIVVTTAYLLAMYIGAQVGMVVGDKLRTIRHHIPHTF